MIKSPQSSSQLLIKEGATGKLLTTSDQQFSIIIFTQREQILGKGAFGKCYIGILQDTSVSSTNDMAENEDSDHYYNQRQKDRNHSIVVVKEIKKNKTHPLQQDLYKRQIQNLSLATRIPSTSRNLVTCFPFIITSQTHYYMLMQYCQGKSLDKLMSKRQKTAKWFNFYQFLKILSDIVSGYYPLNKLMIMHEDLKPQNIFIKGKEFKIGDFGLSFLMKADKESSRGGSLSYNGKQKYSRSKEPPSHKSDMYAMGIILFKLFYGFHPYFQKSQWQHYRYDEMRRLMQLTNIKVPQMKLSRWDELQMFVRFYDTRKVKQGDPLIKKPQQIVQLKPYWSILQRLYDNDIPQMINRLISKQISNRLSFTELNLSMKRNKVNSILKYIQQTKNYYQSKIQLFPDLSSETSNTIKLSSTFDNLKQKVCIEPRLNIQMRDLEVETDMLRTAGCNRQKKAMLRRKYPRVFGMKDKIECINMLTRQFMNVYEQLNQLNLKHLYTALSRNKLPPKSTKSHQYKQSDHNYQLTFYQDKRLQVQFVISKYLYSFLTLIQKQLDTQLNLFNEEQLQVFYRENVDFVMELIERNKEYLESELFISNSEELRLEECQKELQRIIVGEFIGMITLDKGNVVLVYYCVCILKFVEFIAEIIGNNSKDNNKKMHQQFDHNSSNPLLLLNQSESQLQSFIDERNTFTKLIRRMSLRSTSASEQQTELLQKLIKFVKQQLDKNGIPFIESMDETN